MLIPDMNGQADLPRKVADTDVNGVQRWLLKNRLVHLGEAVVHQAVDWRALERRFHPVRPARSPGTDDSLVLSHLAARSPPQSHSLRNPSQSAPVQRHPRKADPVLPAAQIWREA